MKNSPSSANSPNNTSTTPAPFLEFRERVRYSETDRMGVAHNKSYFEWFELGRTEYCRRSGLPYGEEFVIRVALAEATGRKLVFSYELAAVSDGRLVATGQTVHVPTNRRAEVCSLPDDILEKIKGAAA